MTRGWGIACSICPMPEDVVVCEGVFQTFPEIGGVGKTPLPDAVDGRTFAT